ncbi:MAG: hypothetical protein QXU06_04060 [Candidatus Bathyarchaeia archaeon]
MAGLWRYAKESVRRKIMARELSDELIERTLMEPDSIRASGGNRFIAQRLSLRLGFGELLIRVIYEEVDGEKVVVTAYWARPERYLGRGLYGGRV